MIKVKFLDYDCVVRFSNYASNNRTAIQLFVEETGEPMCTASVNLVDEPITEDEIAIKDYSENSGIARVLSRAGIIAHEPLRYVNSGHVTIPIYKLLIKES